MNRFEKFESETHLDYEALLGEWLLDRDFSSDEIMKYLDDGLLTIQGLMEMQKILEDEEHELDSRIDTLREEIQATMAENITDFADLFENFEQNRDNPWIENFLEKLAEENPKEIYINFHIFYNEPYASSILEIAAQRDPSLAFRDDSFNAYKSESYAGNILELAAERAPSTAISFYPVYENQPYADEILKRAFESTVDLDPLRVLRSAHSFREKPYMQKLINTAALKAVRMNPNRALEFLNLFADQECAKEFIEFSVAILGAHIVIGGIENFLGQPWAIPVIEKAIKIQPADVLSLLDTDEFKTQPDRDRITEKTVRAALEHRAYSTVINSRGLYEDQPYASSVLEQAYQGALQVRPWVILSHPDSYKENPERKQEAVRRLMEITPGALLSYYDVIKDEPYVEEVIRQDTFNAAEADPVQVLRHRNVFEGKDYENEILDTAVLCLFETDPDELFYRYPELCSGNNELKEAILDGSPSPFFDALRENIDIQFEEETIEKMAYKAARTETGTAFRYFEIYKDKPYVRKVVSLALENCIENDLDLAFRIIRRIKNHDFEPFTTEDIDPSILRKIVQKSMSSDSTVFLTNRGLFEFDPRISEIISKMIPKIALKAAEVNPQEALLNKDLYQDSPLSSKILELAVRNLLVSNPRMILDYAKKFQYEPYAQSVIEEAAYLDPWYFLEKISDGAFSSLKTIDRERIKNDCLRRVKLAENSFEFISKLIEEEDLKDPETMLVYLLGVDDLSSTIPSPGVDIIQPSTITIPLSSFKTIFLSSTFQSFLLQHTGELTYMNALSLVHATHRYLEREKFSADDKHIEQALVEIDSVWERITPREVFGPDTKLIIFTHEEVRFDNNEILEKLYFSHGGTKENILANAKGLDMTEDGENLNKTKVLEAISSGKGPLTILFNGHGSPENWAFERNFADDLNHSLEESPYSINYKELGDALIESGNISNLNLIAATCFAYDYLLNLFGYIEGKGVFEKPAISISIANQKSFGYGGGEELDDLLLQAVYRHSEEGASIRVQHFLGAEGDVAIYSDPAFMIGLEESLGASKGQEQIKIGEPMNVMEVNPYRGHKGSERPASPTHYLEVADVTRNRKENSFMDRNKKHPFSTA